MEFSRIKAWMSEEISSSKTESIKGERSIRVTFLPFLTNEMLIILIIATFVVALIGAYIGKIVLKKHFEKAGIA